MPQMAPMSWLFLFFIFYIIFLIFNMMIYYCFNFNQQFMIYNNNNKKLMKKNILLNWLW